MVSITASISKKVPVTGVEFSSQQFGASVVVEVMDLVNVPTKLNEVYRVLEQTIEREIAARNDGNGTNGNGDGHPQTPTAAQPTSGNGNGHGNGNGNGHGQPGNGNGNGGSRRATDAQTKAIFAIADGIGMGITELVGICESRYRVNRIEHLSIRDASQLIDWLKSRRPNGGGK